MKFNMRRNNTPILLVLALLLALSSSFPQTAVASWVTDVPGGNQPVFEQGGQGSIVPVMYDPRTLQIHIPAPAAFNRVNAPAAVQVNISYLAAGATNNLRDTCMPFPEQAKAAFTYAANIWGSILSSPVPITIEACWADLQAGVLGHSASGNSYRNFPNAPLQNVWYPVALANAFQGTDMDAGGYDMSIAYSNRYMDQWYFNTDGNTPSSQLDFVSVVLHEITHGLGFSGSMRVSSGIGSWGYSGNSTTVSPMAYDLYAIDLNWKRLIDNYPNNSLALGNALTNGNVFFSGTQAVAANGGNAAKLYAPNPWKSGSSYSHLDEMFNGTPNALMTYSLANGESIHSPGPITLGILQDISWPGINNPTPTPTATTTTPTATTTTPTATTPVPTTTTPTATSTADQSRIVLSIAIKIISLTPIPTTTTTPNPGATGIRGRVLQNGSVANNIPVSLYRYSSGVDQLVSTVNTSSNGTYLFPNPTSLGTNQSYFVFFDNRTLTPDLTRLYSWHTPFLNTYSTGTDYTFADFDIQDVALGSPANSAQVSLPATFSWTPRPASPTDSYQWFAYDPITPSIEFSTNPSGYTDHYTMTLLPLLFWYDISYDWFVIINSPDQGWGTSLVTRQVAFTLGLNNLGNRPDDLSMRPIDIQR